VGSQIDGWRDDGLGRGRVEGGGHRVKEDERNLGWFEGRFLQSDPGRERRVVAAAHGSARADHAELNVLDERDDVDRRILGWAGIGRRRLWRGTSL
jgi:hypothetical protein